MKRLRWLFALPALLIATTGLSTAADIRDKAGLFSTDAIDKALTELDRIERQYSVPVTIETVDSLEGQLIADVINSHAQRAGAKGIYVLIAKKETKILAEVSKAFRTALPREKLKAIDDAFIRQFSKKDFDAGLTRGVSQIESTVAEARPAAKARRAAQAPIAGKPSTGGMGMWLTIGLALLALFIVIRVLGSLFGGGNRGYTGQQQGMGPGMGGPGYGPGYGGGGGGGGFMSSMFGGIGGALAGNWLYDQFSGRRHDSSTAAGYDPAGGAAPADTGPEWGGGGAEGDWGGGGGDTGAGGGGDWGGGGDAGGGGGDWGGGGGGDWGGGGGGGDDGGSW